MSYQVLARKFRPKVFDDVVGQNHVTQTLRNALRLGRVHHAFLFTGTRGCGKTSTARILAKALQCPNAKKLLDPCNECESCLAISAGSSLDVLEIDGASNNGVDSIRELRENTRFMPNKGSYRIYIVDEVHMLSTAAFNALLKTLEEPPPHVVFIFATTEPHKLPSTILSRCQRFDFKRIPPKRIAERLLQIAKDESIEIGPAGLASLARAAEGSMRDAQSLFDQVISFAGRETDAKSTKISDAQIVESLGLIDRKLFEDTLAALAARDGTAALDVASRVATAGYEVENFARELLARIRDLMVVKVVAAPEKLVDLSAEEIDTLKAVAAKFTREEIDALFLMLEASLEEIKRGSTPQLALEMAMLRMSSVEPIAPIADIAARLEALAGGEAPPRPPSPSSPSPRFTPANAPPGATPGRSTSVAPPSDRADAPTPPTARREAVAPPSPAPDREVTGTMEAAIFDWNAYVGWVKNRKPFLGVLLNDAALSKFDGEKLEIAYEQGGIGGDRIREKEATEQLAVLAKDFTGRTLTVRIVSPERTMPEAAAARADAAAPRKNAVEEKRALREEALANEKIQSAMNVLGAELAEVKPVRRSDA